jgi:Copper type II ascorbate-dependent monooxygenase, C-terminal domain
VRALLALTVAAGAVLAVALAASGGTAAGPTYARDVAPILDAKCTSCHRLGGIAPFGLTTAAEAKAHADGIVRMTKAGLMPPWMPGRDSAAFVGQERRRLTASELDTLADWVAAGAPAGRAADRRTTPSTGAGLRGPGRTITLAPRKAYRPHATSGALDDYHCFLLDPKLASDAFVTGALIRPGRTGIVHHVILFEAVGAQGAAAQRLDAASGGKGWSCFGGPGVPPDLSGPDAMLRLGQPPWISAWVPGHVTNSLPAGTGIRLHRGAKIVMQVHYNLIEAAGPDRSRVVLRVRPAKTKLTPLQTMLAPAPVELACPRATTGALCDRTRALVDSATKYGLEAASIPNVLLRLCGKTAADYPRDVGAGKRITTSCRIRVGEPLTIYGVAGHMHLRGRDLRVVLERPAAPARTLLHIPAWDFHWQDAYYLKRPVTIPAGGAVRVQCSFDNSRGAQPVVRGRQVPPRYVVWGEGTTDEMCLGLLQVAKP